MNRRYCALHSFAGKDHEAETCDDCKFINKEFIVNEKHPYLKAGTRVSFNEMMEITLTTKHGMGTTLRNIEVFNPNKFTQFYEEATPSI